MKKLLPCILLLSINLATACNIAEGEKKAPDSSANLANPYLLSEQPKKENQVSQVTKKDLKIGKGLKVANGMKLKLHYKAHLKDGTLVDSSSKNKKPFEFILGEGQVIQGWDLGLVGMKVGGVRRITIPPSLAYGHRGIPKLVPPNSYLIFTIDLIAASKSS